MKKLLLFPREDLKNAGAAFLKEKKDEGFSFIAIDSPTIGLASKERLSFTTIDEWVGYKRLLNARKDASKLELTWFRPLQNILSSNGICWPQYDREAMYWFWRDYTIASQIADKINEDNDTILHVLAKSPPRPGLYYYYSDVCAEILKNLLGKKLNSKKILAEHNRRVEDNFLVCAALKFEDQYSESNFGVSLSNIKDKIVLALNPGELHRFSPVIKSLSVNFPGDVVVISIATNAGNVSKATKDLSVPFVAPSQCPASDSNLSTQFLKAFDYSNIQGSDKWLSELFFKARFHFEYYLRYRWPILDLNYLAWKNLWQKHRPKAVITSQLADSESQLPATAAKKLSIPTFSLPHGGLSTRRDMFFETDYILYNTLTQKEVLHQTGFNEKKLTSCREIIDVNEYPVIPIKKAPASKAYWRVLVITYPISIGNKICPDLTIKCQIDTLKILDSPPEDLSDKLEIIIKPHPGWPDLELFSSVSAELQQKVAHPNQNIIDLLNNTDLVIALNCGGTAPVHVLKAEKPIIFFWTDPLILKCIDPYEFSHFLLPSGILVSEASKLWESVRNYFSDSDFAEELSIKVKNFKKKYLEDSKYPEIVDVVEKVLSGDREKFAETEYGNKNLVQQYHIDQVPVNFESDAVDIPDEQPDYGEMPKHELEILCNIVNKMQPQTVFEFGTFQGRTTLQLAANSKAKLYTLDLPTPGHQDYSVPVVDDPELDVYPQQPGIKFQNTRYAQRIQQLYGDSQHFDFSPFYNKMDAVFVDANHHYEHVLRDSMNAFKMLKSNGFIIWHDYADYAPGVMKALEVVNQRYRILNIKGTSLAAYFSQARIHDQDIFVDLYPRQKNTSGTEALQTGTDRFGNKSDPEAMTLQNDANNGDHANSKAEQMIKAGNINAATRILFEIINKFPADVSALINLAVIEYQQKNYKSAKEFIKDVLILDPANERAKSILRDIETKMNVFMPADRDKPVIRPQDNYAGKGAGNRPKKYIYFGHHKCATTWISAIIEAVCRNIGLCSAKFHNFETAPKDRLNGIQFLSDTNSVSMASELLNGINYAGFHVIRDPRDIVVSAYFSHKKTHASGEWLVEHRKKLNRVDLEQGIRLEMDFRSDELKAMRDWNYKNPRVYETRFEIITADPLKEFKKIFQFLDIFPESLSNHVFEDIIQSHSFSRLSKGRKPGDEDIGSHYRKGIPGDWKNYITGKNKNYFKGRYGQLLIDLGYEKNFDW